jgi:CheY-like chemotaxis protein
MDPPKSKRGSMTAESEAVKRNTSSSILEAPRPTRSSSASTALSASSRLSGLFHGLLRKKKRRVVGVVDDEDRWLKEISVFIMSQPGWDVEIVVAKDGTSALEMINENAEDLCLCLVDMVMPGVSGLQFVTRARADPQLEHVVFMLTTEFSGRSAKMTSTHFSMVDDAGAPITVLTKPLQSAAVAEMIQTLVFTPRSGRITTSESPGSSPMQRTKVKLCELCAVYCVPCIVSLCVLCTLVRCTAFCVL